MALFRFQLRRGTAAQWTAANPVLADGEPGVETDTGALKIGDGATAWAGLPYASDAEVAANINTAGSQTQQALSDAYVARGLYDAKGDLLVGGADNEPVRQAAPPDGTVLIADSTEPTGWRVGPDLRDTDWINVSGELINGWALAPSTGVCFLRRVGPTVFVEIDLDGTGATGQVMFNFPAAFAPALAASPGYAPIPAVDGGGSGAFVPVAAHSSGYLRLVTAAPVNVAHVRAYGSFPCDAPWPS